MNNSLVKGLGALVVTGAIVAVLVWVGGKESIAAIRNAELGPLLLCLAMSLLLLPVASVRWGFLTDNLAGRAVATHWDFFRVRVLSGASGYIAPREMAELGGRTLWLNRFRGVPLAQAAQGVLIDRICDLMVTIAVLLGALIYWFGLGSKELALTTMIVLSALLVWTVPWMMRQVRKGSARSYHGIGKLFEEVPFVRRQLNRLPELAGLSPQGWRLAIILGIVKFVLTLVRILAAAASVRLGVDVLTLTVATPLSQLAYLFAFTPGAIGIYEAGWLTILHTVGTSVSIATAFVLIQRASHIVAIVLFVPFCLLLGPPLTKKTVTRPTSDLSGQGLVEKSNGARSRSRPPTRTSVLEPTSDEAGQVAAVAPVESAGENRA